jgi:hypothetical protein
MAAGLHPIRRSPSSRRFRETIPAVDSDHLDRLRALLLILEHTGLRIVDAVSSRGRHHSERIWIFDSHRHGPMRPFGLGDNTAACAPPARTPPVLSRLTGPDFETLLDRQSCGRAEHIADPQF